MTSCEDEKDRMNLSERNGPLDKVNFVNHDTPDESCSIRNKISGTDVLDNPPISSTLESDVAEAQCNLEPKCAQAKKRKKRNKKRKSQKNKENDPQMDTLTINDNAIRPNACDDSIVDNNAKTDLKIATFPVLTQSQKKKKRRKEKQKLSKCMSADEAHVSRVELDSREAEENVLISENQSDFPSSPSTLVKKHDGTLVQRKRKRKKKKKGKKQKLNTSVSADEGHISCAEVDSIEDEENTLISKKKSDSPSSPSHMVNKHDNNGDASLILGAWRKTKKKKQKLNTAVSTVEACISSAEFYSIEDEKNASVSGKRSDPPSSSSCMVNKDGNDGDASLIFSDQESESYGVHSVELSEHEVERVQTGVDAASVKVVENVVAKKPSSNCLNVDFTCPESKDLLAIKKDACLDVERNVQQVPHPLVGAHVGCANKKLLILDVNGLLADIVPYFHHSYKADIVISRKSVFKRPFCDDFLQFCFEKFNVGVWSSRTKKNVDTVIDFLMGESIHKLLFVWHQSHCTDTGFTTVENSSKPLVLKELKKLWDKLVPGLPWNKGDYNESNTLLLDDSPYKALRNPANTAIFPHSYQYKDAEDCSLGPGGDLRVYLEQLAEAPNVQEYVAQNPFGQRVITESNPSWGFYQKILSVESCQSQEVASSSGPSATGNL